VPCSYTAWDLSGADSGTKVAKASLQYVYDTGNAMSFQAVVNNDRTSAY